MVEIFKRFLWKGTNKAKKWALLSWKWLSKKINRRRIRAARSIYTKPGNGGEIMVEIDTRWRIFVEKVVGEDI